MENNLELTFDFKGRVVKLLFPDFSSEIDVDEITQIDFHNLFAEIITIPALMNRVGLWKAEADNSYSTFKLEIAIKEAQLYEYYQKSLVYEIENSSGKQQKKYPTGDMITQAIVRDPIASLMRKKLLRLQKEADYLDSFYWAIKSKETKLNNLSHTLTPEDMQKDLVNQKFNDIVIKVKNNLI